MKIIICLIISYLIGSISGSLVLGKIRNIDIRDYGSGNAGGTNAFRIIGPLFALIITIIDILKGYLAVKYIPHFFLTNVNQNEYDFIIILIAITCILGHVYPLYFQFNGGKGVGTLLGTLPIILNWKYAVICLIIWIITLLFTGYVGLGSILAGISLPLQYFFIELQNLSIASPTSIYCIGIAIFLILTHRENIKRMWIGTEYRFHKVMIINLFSHKS